VFPPLAPLLGQTAGTLSGGERRMVSVGRALMSDASLYLVDEPSLGLAPKISLNLVAALLEIDLGDGAMIIAEQNLPLIEGRVDRVLGMHAGELKLDVGEALGDVPPAAGVHL
ncbi:MAG: ATP-binding cassette domain-containing protein, partial [Actinomycetota bacterium]